MGRIRPAGKVTKEESSCIICGRLRTEDHHLLMGSCRGYADMDGLYIPICDNCHTREKLALHNNPPALLLGKMLGQAIWERNQLLRKHYSDYADKGLEVLHQDFINRYGKSWL